LEFLNKTKVRRTWERLGSLWLKFFARLVKVHLLMTKSPFPNVDIHTKQPGIKWTSTLDVDDRSYKMIQLIHFH
jgi:hypothetical protein